MNNNDALARLHKLFDEDPLDEHDEHDRASELDELVDDALPQADLLSLSQETQELLLGLTESSSSLEPLTRKRLVGAADRGMARRRDDASPLPRLLFVIRNRDNQQLDMVAESVNVEYSMLRAIERGECDIRLLGAGGVASWIQFFGVPADTAIPALRATFALAADPDRASASATENLLAEQDKFVDEVSEILNNA
jgi:hypothetical protein